jgi:hypothetical protein
MALEVLAEQGGPGFAQDAASDLYLVVVVSGEQQFVEEELVGVAPDLWSAEAVDVVDAADVGEGCSQCLLDPGVDHFGGVEHGGSVFEFGGDAVLFFAGEVFRDRAADHAPG